MGVVGIPAVTRAASTSMVERGSTGPTVISLMAQEDTERRAQFRSKSMAWKEPMLLFQRMSSRKASQVGVRSLRQKDGQELHHHNRRPSNSKWARFWRKLRFDGVGKKVHAARPDWVKYDSQSYAMNFGRDMEMPFSHSQEMSKISGPGAREIVTVLLQRSPSMNQNSGCILIPKPVLDVKHAANAPLWMRRSVQAPASLDLKMKRTPTMRRRPSAAA